MFAKYVSAKPQITSNGMLLYVATLSLFRLDFLFISLFLLCRHRHSRHLPCESWLKKAYNVNVICYICYHCQPCAYVMFARMLTANIISWRLGWCWSAFVVTESKSWAVKLKMWAEKTEDCLNRSTKGQKDYRHIMSGHFWNSHQSSSCLNSKKSVWHVTYVLQGLGCW